MAALTGKKPKDTYKDLLQVSNSNAGIDGTLRFVSDGEGTDSTLKLSTTAISTTSKVVVGGDTAAGDDAAIGFTAAEGLILTGQGSTNDITIKNDADAAVISVPTGTTNVTLAGDLTISGDDLTMGTNTSGAALIADGTNFNPVVISGDAAIATNGALTIANDAVTLAKMAGLARGKLIYGDSSGDPAALAVGSANNVLKTDGTDVSWGTVATAGIADDAITSAKIADDAVVTAAIADDAITSALIADDAVGSAAIADDAITAALIADDAVGSAAIADDAITSALIADDAVVTAAIADDAITSALIADDAVVSAAIADNAVTTPLINDDAVTLAKMAGLARGKIIYGDSSGNPAALAIGSNTYVLTSDGTDAAWAAAATGAVTSYTNSTDNRVITSVDSSTINGEANLTFDGSVLAVAGNVTATGTIEPAGDTSASDNAAIGYTSAEGLILTGQGSTSDLTVKNDADATVFSIPTGTDDVLFPDDAKAMWGDGSDMTVHWDGTDGHLTVAGTLNIDGSGETMATFVDDGAVTLYHNNVAKVATSANGVSVTGTLLATTDTDTSNTGSVTLDFSTNQNFVLTFTGNVTLANPTTEQVGQAGVIVCIQDGTGSRTLSLGSQYKTVGDAGITLSTAANAVDIIPYFVSAADSILIGAVQLALSGA